MCPNENDKLEQTNTYWECRYIDLTGDTFLGRCLWFREHGLEVKEIPPNKVDEVVSIFKKNKLSKKGVFNDCYQE